MSRYRFIRFWNNSWNLYKHFNYSSFVFLDKIFNVFLNSFFYSTKIIKNYITFGDIKILRTLSCVHIYIFFHDIFYKRLVKQKTKKKIKQKKENNIITFPTLLKVFFHILFYNFSCFELFESFLRVNDKNYNFHLSSFFFLNFLLVKKVNNIILLNYEKLIKSKLSSFFMYRESPIGFTPTFRSFYVELEKVSLSRVPYDLKKKLRFNLKSFLYFTSKVSEKFFKTACNVRFTKISNRTTSALFYCNLLLYKILKLGRPSNRRNKLTKRFFMSFLNRARRNKLINGLKIHLAGRINRRGRAMWKQYFFGKSPKGSFNLAVDFAKKSIKTVNGILTIKILLFRNKQFNYKFSDFNLLNSNSLIKESLYSKFSNEILKKISLNKTKSKRMINEKRRLKKLKKSSISSEKFYLIH